MRIAFLVVDVDAAAGTSRSALTQAAALAEDHDVRVVSLTRTAGRPHFSVSERVTVEHLVDVRDAGAPTVSTGPRLEARTAHALHQRESALVPRAWDRRFTGLGDVALESALPGLDVDVVVTLSSGLLAAAVELLDDQVVLVHQEHRSPSDKSAGPEALLAFAPIADLVALPTSSIETWLHEQLGDRVPPTVVIPPSLPIGFAPRSRLDQPLILAAGRLMPPKQFPRLVQAFAQVADQIPQWRLRICGEGRQRASIIRQIRKFDLYDRIELPGAVPDMAAEWATASVAALTSQAEAFPIGVQEAMAAGVPVVSFDSAYGPREIIRHEHNGLLVAPQSISGMAAALLRLATDDDLRHRLGGEALRTAREYDAHALAERWTGIYADARAARRRPGRLTSRATARAPRRTGRGAPPTAPPTDLTPVRARHEALATAAAAGRASGDDWLVIPAHERPAPSVVVPMRDRDGFLAALAAPGAAPAYLSLRDPAENGWPERRGPVADLATDLRRGMTSLVHLEPWPTVDGTSSLVGQGCSVEIQFWESGPDGDLLAPRRNPYASRLPADPTTVPVEVDGVSVRSLPSMTEPTVTECRFPVDVVYTWVDGSDPEWNDARERRLAQVPGTPQTRESSGRARFLPRDELRYSMRSIHLFAPWVRRIHLVTAGQTPDWLDVEHPMIDLVDHSQILPAEALPTFNSHAIETALHRIEGLTEHFVYLNDDFLLGRPLRPEHFFGPAGLCAAFLSVMTMELEHGADAAPFLKAAGNNRALLHEAFGALPTVTLAHAPYAHRVSVLQELAERFPEALAATARSPFRSDADLSSLSSLAQHYGLLTGRAYAAEADLAYINLANPEVAFQLRSALNRDQDFLCLADDHDHAMRADELDELLAGFYESYYPVRAPWERA